ncbi:MAG TPA: histidine phosphatase family protein [Candidatus Limnocylindria bacterium]|nr:histidine phosphatase family protein [Candidatus Limnocylindria bacterium]
MIRRLLLVRHGVTTWNREGRFQGHLDPPLDPLGEQEAAALAGRLVREVPEALSIVSSPLQRATATARIIADAFAADGRLIAVQLEPGLMEIGQGEWEGRTHGELAQADAERYRTWAATGGWHEPPGAEPATDAANRAADAVSRMLAAADPSLAETLCCVSHGGILRLLAGRLAGLPDEQSWALQVDNASLSELRHTAGGWQIEAWNETSHLAGELTAEDRRAEGSPPAL